MENKEKLVDYINNSELTPADKAEWLLMIEKAPLDYVENLTQMVEKFPAELGWLNDMYKRKRAAFFLREKDKGASEKLLTEIYGEEKQKLAELYNKTEI